MKKNRVFMPPYDYDNSSYTICGVFPLNLFLGGTIDNGNSLDWQSAIIEELNSIQNISTFFQYLSDEKVSQNEKINVHVPAVCRHYRHGTGGRKRNEDQSKRNDVRTL